MGSGSPEGVGADDGDPLARGQHRAVGLAGLVVLGRRAASLTCNRYSKSQHRILTL